MPFKALGGRQYEFIAPEERTKMQVVLSWRDLSSQQKTYNMYLNGDWKRQYYYKPSTREIAEMVRYGWVHDANFNSIVSSAAKAINLEGGFVRCPIPTLIMEGEWDMTWGKEKPAALHGNHPNAQLVIFSESGHSPFYDEPDNFFDVLREFVAGLPEIAANDIAQWKQEVAAWREKKRDQMFASPIGEEEARHIARFREIRKTLDTKPYENTSSPIDTVLSLFSALKSANSKAVERLFPVDLARAGGNVEQAIPHMQELLMFDVLRAPLPPKTPEQGTLWPVYVKLRSSEGLAGTFILVFWNGEWLWAGNQNGAGDWRSMVPMVKSQLQKFGKKTG